LVPRAVTELDPESWEHPNCGRWLREQSSSTLSRLRRRGLHADDLIQGAYGEVSYPRCAGLDVHKAEVTACRRVAFDGKVSQDVRSFPTVTSGLLELAEWLGEAGCTPVAMEATGVYWKPVWHVLEGSFELVLANAQHVRNVSGRSPTSATRCGWPISSPTGSFAAASSRQRQCRRCET
jgi:hypothetical protein